MIDIQDELRRLADARPDIAAFFRQHVTTPGGMAALELLLTQRAIARESLYERQNGHGGHDTVLRYHPVVLANQLCTIAGVTHLTPYEPEWVQERKAVDDSNTRHPFIREAGSGA